jgi:DNA-binding response OmpR family regulator
MPGTHLILVADADATLLRKVTSLAKQEGYEIITTSTGAELLELALAHRPELIVLDIAFPDADGRDLLQQIKRNEKLKDIHVLMWSERDYDSDRRIALELGAADYLAKSDSVMLMPKIARVLLHAKQQSQMARRS